MAIIYSYPNKATLVAADTLLISDSEDSNKTKIVTAQEIANYVDGEVTLQEVLDTGSTAVSNLGGWAGIMSLSKSGAPAINVILDVNASSGTSGTAAIYTTSNAEIGGRLKVIGNTTIDGDLSMSLATSDIIMNDGDITTQTGTDLNFVVNTSSKGYNFEPSTTGVDFNVGIGANRLLNTYWELNGDFDLDALGNVVFSSNTQTILSGNNAIFASTGGDTIIGANDTLFLGQTTGPYEPTDTVIHAEQTITLSTDTGSTNFKLNGQNLVPGPQLESNSPHYFDDEIRLDGKSAGTDGQVMISKGTGVSPEWVDTSTLSVENLIEEVENNTGSLIPKGTPIYIAANPAGTPRVAPADSSDPLKMPASGLAVDDIPAGVGQPGQMIISGQLSSVSVVGFGIGDIAYVGPGGGLVAVKPFGATEGIQNVGIVTKTGGSGSIQVTAIGRVNDLPNNNPNALFTADGNGHPLSTAGFFEVDIASFTTSILNKYIINASSPYGNNNNIIGEHAGEQLFSVGGTASNNVYLGTLVAAGQGSILGDDTNYNIGIGSQTLAGNNSNGTDPLRNTSSQNIAIGHQAMSQPGGGAGPTTAHLGQGNIAIGYQAATGLYDNGGGEGTQNVIVGNTAGFNVALANHSTLIGANTGGVLTDGIGNTCIGYNAAVRNPTDTKVVAIGYNASAESLGVALGSGAVAGPGELNINVAGVVTPFGGLQVYPDDAAAGVAGLGSGDVYLIDLVATGGPAAWSMCIKA